MANSGPFAILNQFASTLATPTESRSLNVGISQLSDRISLHIFSSHAELGLLAGTPRIECRIYSFDEDTEILEGG